jgi:hypothetical protein
LRFRSTLFSTTGGRLWSRRGFLFEEAIARLGQHLLAGVASAL